MFFISEYRVERCYGGPEEGGWWYDAPEHVRVLAVASAKDDAYAICRGLNAETDNRDHYGRDRYSVNGGADTVFYVDDEIGEHTLTERPFYC